MAWNGVGLVLVELKKLEDARNAYGRAIQAKPNYAEAHYNLSFVLSNLGDYEGALKATKRALEIDPYYVQQKFELAIDLEFEDPTVRDRA
jgi:tetratricopeptide (TPR) repeat protein